MVTLLQTVARTGGSPVAGEHTAPKTNETSLTVNGEVVPQTVIAAETQHQTAPKGKPGTAWKKAARAVAIRTLLLQEARSRGIEAERLEVGPGRFETDEEASIRCLLEDAVHVSMPSSEAVREEWQKDPARFKTPPLWEVSHILTACDPRNIEERDEALEQAKAIAAMVAESPKSFALIASQKSDCGSKSSGGALGQLGPGGSVPEFEEALRNLEDGEVTSEPVLSRHGYHIIRMDAVAPGQVLPFEAVREKILNTLEKTAWAKGARAFVASLIESSKIEGADFNIA